MQAIQISKFGGPEVLEWKEDVQVPNFGDGEVLIDVKAAGVNPVDTYIHSGTYALVPNLPYTPGKDGAGVVSAVGNGVTRVKVGDRVYIAGANTGTYATKTVASEDVLHPLPDNVDFAEGACVAIPYGTAYRALFVRADARPGDVVLVHGASGGVGIATVQLAKARGCIVLGTAGTKEGMELVLREGADYVFNHREEDYVNEIKEVAETHGGVNVIAEMLANVNLATDTELIAKNGRIVVIGNRGTIEINPRFLMGKEASILGAMCLACTPEEYKQTHSAIVAGLRNSTLRPIVGSTLPLTEAGRAHDDVINSSHTGNITLLVD
eukprot:CAMPEP_0174261904 /NCGR_PEP_ID=MMETSP0439-20130205/12642_1 /TAXON_ID=0 /ORGANISM="Stereomyxa ramosa, Strain Chinc5" /LENGTH=323 /DNA_ID=CAMNT_0015346509 /DNA_START=92 /DNA_END=1063 /DNA_ORIENTATION=-